MKGMPIIAHKTVKKLDIFNSERFTITNITDKVMNITDGFKTIKIDTKKFHNFFYLGFCITINASQGETFNEKYTIHDFGYKHFYNKAQYVALSRSTNIKNIQKCKWEKTKI